MRKLGLVLVIAACGGDGGGDGVPGKMSFVLGGTSGTGMVAPLAPARPLTAGDEYVVSPRKAKLTFASAAFRQQDGNKLGGNDVPFTDCNVTYDRSAPSGSTLLDCPIDIPVGEVFQMDINFNKAMQILVSDPTAGIYSDPSVPSGYSTTAPAGGADFVPYTVMIGDSSPTRGAIVIFNEPITVAADSTPQIFVTTDMVQTFQIKVDPSGSTLTAHPGNDPVALFAGLTAGSSRFFSNAGSIESYKTGSVNNFHSLRIFYDGNDRPLFLMSPNTCGPDGPKGAWATPPIGATIGGWLGKDSNNVIAWAQPRDPSWSEYTAYYVMNDQNVIGSSFALQCKATTSPPPPTDGKTYASGAPAITAPDDQTMFTLLTK